MSALSLLESLRALGVRLTVLRGELHWHCPATVIDDKISAELAEHMAELVELLLSRGGRGGAGVLSCWFCWALWQPEWFTCQSCSAIAPGLSDLEMDRSIYGPGTWF